MLLLTFMAKCDWVTLSKLGINNAVCTEGCNSFIVLLTTKRLIPNMVAKAVAVLLLVCCLALTSDGEYLSLSSY